MLLAKNKQEGSGSFHGPLRYKSVCLFAMKCSDPESKLFMIYQVVNVSWIFFQCFYSISGDETRRHASLKYKDE